MAEALLRRLGGDRFEAESAGLEPGELNLLVVAAMHEIGIDISRARTKSVSDLSKRGLEFDCVVTVCDEASAERCPAFPGTARKRLHWSFADPAQLPGTSKERLAGTRAIRDQIKAKIEEFLSSAGGKKPG